MFRNIGASYESYIREKFFYLTKEEKVEVTYWMKQNRGNSATTDEIIFSSLKLFSEVASEEDSK